MTTIDDEIALVQSLSPYVTDIKKSFGAYVGWFMGKPIFKVDGGSKNIHILCYKDLKNFHKDTKSVKVAIKHITESVEVIKKIVAEEKLKKIEQDFK